MPVFYEWWVLQLFFIVLEARLSFISHEWEIHFTFLAVSNWVKKFSLFTHSKAFEILGVSLWPDNIAISTRAVTFWEIKAHCLLSPYQSIPLTGFISLSSSLILILASGQITSLMTRVVSVCLIIIFAFHLVVIIWVKIIFLSCRFVSPCFRVLYLLTKALATF